MIRAAALLITLALLAACATRPMQYEDDDVIIVKGIVLLKHPDRRTPENIREVTDHYTKPVLDDAERRALRWRAGFETADFITTVVGLNMGCSESNPLLGKSPAVGWIVAAKVIPTLIAYRHAKASPAAFSSARKTRQGNCVMGGVVAWNLYMLSRGCGL